MQSRIVVPSSASARMMPQTWFRERGSRPVVGSSRNISSGRDDDAGGEVEPAAHAARVVLDEPAGRLGKPERVEQLVGAGLRVGAPKPEQPADQDQVLAPGQVLVDRGELAGQARPRRGRHPPR